MGLDTKTYWLTDSQSQCDLDYESLETAVDDSEEMARKEFGCENETSCVL
jgi:hypothetical protein